ncbi:hypothetical protein ES708_24044 [subsurface metagenome]
MYVSPVFADTTSEWNDVTQNLTMQGTGAWDNWTLDSAVIELNEGFVNTIRFETTGADFGNLDEITIKEKLFTGLEENESMSLNGVIDRLKAMPNPFNESVLLHYNVNEPCTVSVMIYNSQGQLISSLINRKHETGDHYLEWNVRDQRGELVPTGVYYCRIISDNYQTNIKLLYIGE